MSGKEPIIIGVAGGSGSGKTTVSQAILERVGAERIAYIQHDSYYRELSHLSYEERTRVNFDHPDALDNDLLGAHLDALCKKLFKILLWSPRIDFGQHVRVVGPALLVTALLQLGQGGTAWQHDYRIHQT